MVVRSALMLELTCCASLLLSPLASERRDHVLADVRRSWIEVLVEDDGIPAGG